MTLRISRPQSTCASHTRAQRLSCVHQPSQRSAARRLGITARCVATPICLHRVWRAAAHRHMCRFRLC